MREIQFVNQGTDIFIPARYYARCLSFILLLLFFSNSCIRAQDKTAADSSSKSWNLEGAMGLYFIPGDFFLMPVIRADKGHLHLEGRYNYEDRNTVSVWGGYNMSFGNKLLLEATPMAGFVFGPTGAFAPGIEFTLSYGKFSLYHETEYLMSFSSRQENYYYQWSEFGFSPNDWISFGLAAQRSRTFQLKRDLQRGFFVGGTFKKFSFSGYSFNTFDADRYFVLSLGVEF